MPADLPEGLTPAEVAEVVTVALLGRRCIPGVSGVYTVWLVDAPWQAAPQVYCYDKAELLAAVRGEYMHWRRLMQERNHQIRHAWVTGQPEPCEGGVFVRKVANE